MEFKPELIDLNKQMNMEEFRDKIASYILKPEQRAAFA